MCNKVFLLASTMLLATVGAEEAVYSFDEDGEAIIDPAVRAVSYPTKKPKGFCQSQCLKTPACLKQNPAQGSYCKNWNNPPVCFGLYVKPSAPSKTCFQPNDGLCNDKVLQPLYC
jgi:hypothetical protein